MVDTKLRQRNQNSLESLFKSDLNKISSGRVHISFSALKSGISSREGNAES